jgi:hypothetical protein
MTPRIEPLSEPYAPDVAAHLDAMSPGTPPIRLGTLIGLVPQVNDSPDTVSPQRCPTVRRQTAGRIATNHGPPRYRGTTPTRKASQIPDVVRIPPVQMPLIDLHSHRTPTCKPRLLRFLAANTAAMITPATSQETPRNLAWVSAFQNA